MAGSQFQLSATDTNPLTNGAWKKEDEEEVGSAALENKLQEGDVWVGEIVDIGSAIADDKRRPGR